MGNSCNHEHEEEIEEDICCTKRRGTKYSLGRVSVITVISSYILNSKVIQQYQIELFGTEVDLSDKKLLSNLMRRGDVYLEYK